MGRCSGGTTPPLMTFFRKPPSSPRVARRLTDTLATHVRGLGALIAVLVVVIVGPGSFGMGSVRGSTPSGHAKLTAVEPAARPMNLAPTAQSNAKGLTDEIRGL